MVVFEPQTGDSVSAQASCSFPFEDIRDGKKVGDSRR